MKNIILFILIILPMFLNGQELKTKKKKGKYFFYFGNEKVNLNPYNEVEKISFHDYYLVKLDKWGVVDSSGIEIIDCKYDSIFFEPKNHFIVELNGKFGVLNTKNEEVVEIIYQEIDYYLEDSIALVKLDDKWGALKYDSIHYDKEKLIFETPEEMPKFTDCEEGSVNDYTFDSKCYEQLMFTYLFEELNYPIEAREKNISGLVVISFIVTETGDIENPIIRRDIGGGCGAEAIRVVKKMENWIPGKQDGVNVKTIYNLPVRFKLK